MTGPPGSADIGGVTVHPAQGVKTLTVILCPLRILTIEARFEFKRSVILARHMEHGVDSAVEAPGNYRINLHPTVVTLQQKPLLEALAL
jgi:hypothetical protein